MWCGLLWCGGIPTKSTGEPRVALLDGALHKVLAMVCFVCINVNVVGRDADDDDDDDDDDDVDDVLSIGD